MGAEFKLKKYEIYFVNGDIQTITMSQFKFKDFIKNNKIKGYKIF